MVSDDPPFTRAVKELGLSPQEQYLYYHHLNNLYGTGKLERPDGAVSTVSQAVVSGPGSLYYSIPTIWEGRELPIDQARLRASQQGWGNFPAYATPEQADMRYQTIHPYIEQDTVDYMRTRRPLR